MIDIVTVTVFYFHSVISQLRTEKTKIAVKNTVGINKNLRYHCGLCGVLNSCFLLGII